MLLIMRILAQILDIFVYIFIVVVSHIYLYPSFLENYVSSLIINYGFFLFITAIYFLLQSIFFQNSQTIGKAFFGLYIVSTVPTKNSNFTTVFIREIFLKLMVIYVLCIPLLFGNQGFHEICTNTKLSFKK